MFIDETDRLPMRLDQHVVVAAILVDIGHTDLDRRITVAVAAKVHLVATVVEIVDAVMTPAALEDECVRPASACKPVRTGAALQLIDAGSAIQTIRSGLAEEGVASSAT